MKLYIWDINILQNYGDGIAFGVAESAAEAGAAILRAFDENEKDSYCPSFMASQRQELAVALSLPPQHVLDLPAGGYLEGTN